MARSFHTLCGTLIRGNFLYCEELGARKFLCLQRYQGKVRLHLRTYQLDEEQYVLIPTIRGATLDKSQTRDLMMSLTELGSVLTNDEEVSF